MKHIKHWLAIMAVLLCSLAASAEDFEVDGIYYNITSAEDLTVEVTYRGDYYYDYSNEYSGAVIIPSTVTYNSITYNVTSIGDYAFSDCYNNLAAITIPEGVTSIGDDAFRNCSSLERVTINCANVGSWFKGLDSIKEIVLGEGVTSIGESAFYDCISLTSITIPEDVTSIGDLAFSSCNSLTSITIPENSQLTSIGNGAFSGCSSLTAITIPESVTSIGDYAFGACSSLTSITIGKGVVEIGEEVFYNCSSLTDVDVHIASVESWLVNNMANSIGQSYSLYLDGDLLTNVEIPSSVTAIPAYAFYYCSSLTSIVIPEGVTSIGDYTFNGCSSLASITIPEGVTSIGGYAFRNCSSLERVTINCANVGNWFKGLYSIKEVVLGERVTSIGESAFEGCGGLTSITIPRSVTSIGINSFTSCSSLREVIFEDGSDILELNLTLSRGELFYRSPLEKVYVGRNLSCGSRRIKFSPFYSIVASDYSLTIGADVTSIGNYAFYKCSGLTSIICDAVTPPAIGGSYTFNGVDKSIPVYVPAGSEKTSI